MDGELVEPLTEDELTTLRMMARAMIQAKNGRDLELFAALEPEQKQQFWNSLPVTLRQQLTKLKTVSVP
jgi:hypothetical protein